jgi:hypothetical protein
MKPSLKLRHIIPAILIGLALSGCTTQPQTVAENQVPQDTVAMTQPDVVNEPETEPQYESYCNSKYAFCIDYPTNVLHPQGESGSGDGQVFTSSDLEDSLSVYRDFSDMIDPDTKFSIKAEYEHDLAGNENGRGKREVTYKKLGKDFFVLSGYMGDKIFYQKTMITNGELATCMMSYRKSEKELYNKVSERVFKSFK